MRFFLLHKDYLKILYGDYIASYTRAKLKMSCIYENRSSLFLPNYNQNCN
jgi:hypothetical protein